ncbi:MAG: anti-sigma factor antagonist [Planctomycetaceae bacterium]|nr:MAG: anti-sigma factor antagonist [Planctomycetaceae bacterium]
MNITAESYGHTVLLHLKGDLTEDSLTAFRQSVEHNIAGKDIVDVVLNMDTVGFIDSAGLEELLNLQDKLAERLGQVKLIGPDENIQKILEITRLASSFETFKDVTEAVKSIHA